MITRSLIKTKKNGTGKYHISDRKWYSILKKNLHLVKKNTGLRTKCTLSGQATYRPILKLQGIRTKCTLSGWATYRLILKLQGIRTKCTLSGRATYKPILKLQGIRTKCTLSGRATQRHIGLYWNYNNTYIAYNYY